MKNLTMWWVILNGLGFSPQRKKPGAKANELNAHAKLEELRRVAISLFEDPSGTKVPIVAIELDDTRARVILDNEDFGIYDFTRRTFVD